MAAATRIGVVMPTPGRGNHGRSDKRQRIIDAAVEVFAEKGFFGARVSEIAEAAGVADGTIYLYFKSKDDILISVFEEKMTWIVRRLQEILNPLEGAEAKLRRYVVEHLQLVLEQPKLIQVLTVELRQSARFVKQHSPKGFAKYLAVIGHILDEGQRTGVFLPSLDTGLFRRALFGAIDEISLEWVLGSPPADPRAAANQVADFILRGLCVRAISPTPNEDTDVQ